MKQMMKIGSAAVISAFLMVGCSSKEADTSAGDAKHADAVHVENVTVEQLHKAVMAAGEAEGWKMTEFKSNEILAEKFGDDEASVSIKLSRHGYEIHGDNAGDLEDAIEEQLSAESSH
ncbi:MAG: hypothetical protein U9Q62_12820 [Campylobacterota bacterium]|nr:hypothetical protein [Campylobacterota bacterium]